MARAIAILVTRAEDACFQLALLTTFGTETNLAIRSYANERKVSQFHRGLQ